MTLLEHVDAIKKLKRKADEYERTGSENSTYTGYRRWTRVAVLTETTERVGPGQTGILREDGALQPLGTLAGGEKVTEKEKEKKDGSLESGSSQPPIERQKLVVLVSNVHVTCWC
ncbi:hypothetical protein BJV78DRAFT_1150889 [Lactifluus subvellereus]|nr:hypothetical protein BJV78DRAFT_1150889 [Lactifluus subvellereus]